MSFTAAGDPRSPWPFGDPVATALLGLLEVELRGHGLHWRVAAPERLEVFRDGAPRPGRMIEVSALRDRMARGAKADWPDLVEAAVADWLSGPERGGRGPGSAGSLSGYAAPGPFGVAERADRGASVSLGGNGVPGSFGVAERVDRGTPGLLGGNGVPGSFGVAERMDRGTSGLLGGNGVPGSFGAAERADRGTSGSFGGNGVPGSFGVARSPAVPAWAAPLRSRLMPAQLATATAGALARPALPGLTEVVLCETGPRGGGRLLAAEQAGNWPAAPTEIFAAARANVRQQGALPTERRNVEGANLTLLGGPGPYCPTHVFWLGEYLRRDGVEADGNGALVVLPHRHLVAYHAIETREAVAAAGALLRLASRQFETSPGPLTDQIYWWRADRVSALPVDSAGETLTLLPTPEFEDLLGRLPEL